MTNEQIKDRLRTLTQEERCITREILTLINLAEDRKLYLEEGGKNMVGWLIKNYGYSGPAAQRRVDAARVLRAVPEVEVKVLSGELNLSTLCKAQSIFRAEEKRSKEKLSEEVKVEAVSAIENQSTHQAERILGGIFPEALPMIKKTQSRTVRNDEIRLSITLAREDFEFLERAKELLGHALPAGDLAEVVAYVFREFCKKKDPLLQKKTFAAEAGCGKTISKPVRRAVYQRDKGKCQFVDPKTKQICGSTTRIEMDHIKPKALGGTNELENLRCLCRAHNAHRARKTFGSQSPA